MTYRKRHLVVLIVMMLVVSCKEIAITTQDPRVDTLATEMVALRDTLARATTRLYDRWFTTDETIDECDSMQFDLLARVATLEAAASPLPEPMHIDSLGIDIYSITGDRWTYYWEHDFKDVKGETEISLDFEVGLEQYESLSDLAAGKKIGLWRGFLPQTFLLSDLITYGYMDTGGTWWREFSFPFSGLKPFKFYVFSIHAIDAAGNSSDWVTSIDTTRDWRYAVYREK